tara:strand:+ start:1592 stop:1957 length:366 start_codon:yes stop_codon:yes gene_type:complete
MEICIPYHLDLAAAAVGSEYLPLYRKLTLKEVRLVANVTFAADASHYITLSIKNGSTTLASRATNSSGLTAGASEALTLSGGSALDFEDLEELEMNIAKNGTPVPVTDFTLLFVFEPARAV